jgi:hypothetical protein
LFSFPSPSQLVATSPLVASVSVTSDNIDGGDVDAS